MANVYESDDFDIESVYLTPEPPVDPTDPQDFESDRWFCVVQRKPLSLYPLKTEIYLSVTDISVTVTKEEFIALAPNLISAKIAENDSQENGVWESSASLVQSLAEEKFST